MESLCIQRGNNDLLVTEEGRELIDLQSGFGAVFLGHANPRIVRDVGAQLERIWTSGRMPTTIAAKAQELLNAFLPPPLQPAGFGSTGLEAAEFALRIAAGLTGRSGFIGFERGMHGKSVATASLCWPNACVSLPAFYRLAFVPDAAEEAILERLEGLLAAKTVAGVFVEPIQGSGAGHAASQSFYQELVILCRRYGTLAIFDEILTGFFRTGTPFFCSELDPKPDLLLVGKGLGNGFPVSAVALDGRYSVSAAMLPGSTFSGNPLASAAVTATLTEMQRLDMRQRLARIEHTIRSSLGGLQSAGIRLRGKGALWMVEAPPGVSTHGLAAAVQRDGVLLSATDSFFRLLPAATIEPENLQKACDVVRAALEGAVNGAA